MWEEKFDINEIKELRCKTTLYLGVGAIQKADDICATMKNDGINKIMVVASRSAYKVCGAWEVVDSAFRKHGIECQIYDQVLSNPTVEQVDEAAAQAKAIGAQAVWGIGGGSPIDASKAVAILVEYPDKSAKELFMHSFVPEKALPLVAVNTTHGTGTEVDRISVVSIPDSQFKPAIAYDCIYPLYSIDDPALCVKLPKDQTIYVSIDALNHVTEAATTSIASPYSILLAKETIRLVSKYLPRAIEAPDNLTARYWLHYASAIAGISFDCGLLHFTHALQHPMSAVKPELPHGLGLAMLLPAVLKKIYAAAPEVLAEIYSPIVEDLKGDPSEAETLASGVEQWLFKLGVTSKLEQEGFTREDVDKLVQLVHDTPILSNLVSLAPIENPEQSISDIYMESLQRIC
jgi:alcohol dehydrogenase class IV